MKDPDLSGLTISQALEIAQANQNVPVKVQKKLEEKYVDVSQKVESMPHSYLPDRDEYAVLIHYQERFKYNAQYEEVIKRFLKHDNRSAIGTLGIREESRSAMSSSRSTQGQQQDRSHLSSQGLSEDTQAKPAIIVIRRKVDLAFPALTAAVPARARIIFDWDLPRFMKTQYHGNDQTALGSVITLSGSALCAEATTCSDYVNKTWPANGATVLRAFEKALCSSNKHYYYQTPGLRLSVTFHPASLCFLEITASDKHAFSQILEQVIWMGAALRTSSFGRVKYSAFDLEREGLVSTDVSFEVNFHECELSESDQSCWIPLFTNAVIALGFPVSGRRNEEQGLEIPLEMMAALGGARHMTDYEGGLVLKGFSAMFVPVKSYNGSVQWHLTFDEQGNRLSYRELKKLTLPRALLHQVNHNSLKGARAFLGWWKAAETHLGTQDVEYKSIDWSSASQARKPLQLSSVDIGFQWMATAKLSFIMGAKDGISHFHLDGPFQFQRIIRCAKDTPVVLYDLKAQQGWLVPATAVMLHVIHTRHRLFPYRVGGKIVELPFADPQGGHSAEDAILKNQLQLIKIADSPGGKSYSFKDAILDLWSQMDRIRDEDNRVEANDGRALHGTMRSKLRGWEFMSLVVEKNHRRKEAQILKSNGGWVDLIDDIDTLVLMGTGFGEIIKPVSDLNRLCSRWRSLPKEKDYLAANISTMEVLYAEAGSRDSHKHLSTNHLQWHRGSTLFENCTARSPDECKCDRTQQIYHDSRLRTFGNVRPPGRLESMGCVVFGRAHHPFKPTRIVTNRENPIHGLPNLPLQDFERVQPSPSPDENMTATSVNGLSIADPSVDQTPRFALPKKPSSSLHTSKDVSSIGYMVAERRFEMPLRPTSSKVLKSEENGDPSEGGSRSYRAHPSHNYGDISEQYESNLSTSKTEKLKPRVAWSDINDDYDRAQSDYPHRDSQDGEMC